MMKKINIIFMVFLLGLIFSCKAQQRQENIAEEIIGTWIAEDDTKVTLIFKTDGTYLSYYDDELISVFDYTITEKCGNEHDENARFLKSIDREDNGEYCYELYGADSSANGILSMRFMSNGKMFVFIRG